MLDNDDDYMELSLSDVVSILAWGSIFTLAWLLILSMLPFTWLTISGFLFFILVATFSAASRMERKTKSTTNKDRGQNE